MTIWKYLLWDDKALISHSSVQINRADAQMSDICSIFPLGIKVKFLCIYGSRRGMIAKKMREKKWRETVETEERKGRNSTYQVTERTRNQHVIHKYSIVSYVISVCIYISIVHSKDNFLEKTFQSITPAYLIVILV